MSAATAAIPWDQIRADFMNATDIISRLSFRALSETYAVPYRSLLARARRERWEAKRELLHARTLLREYEAEFQRRRRPVQRVAERIARACRAGNMAAVHREIWGHHLEMDLFQHSANAILRLRKRAKRAEAGVRA